MSRHKKGFAGRSLSLFIALILVLGLLGAAQVFRPLPTATAQQSTPVLPTTEVTSLAWPNYGQAAVGALGYGVLETKGQQKPVPIASIAKIITALSILQKKPLELGQQGPNITITQADMAIFNEYYVKDGSLAQVRVGQKISQYNALQAILLPSANNLADTTAIWAFGSLNQYTVFANTFVKSLGMQNTQVSDASGFSPNTMSTAQDLVLLGQAAHSNPVIAEVIGQKQVNIPVTGTVYNVNGLLGKYGINGIKTGNTNEAGGCFLGSAKHIVDGKEITVISAILGAENLVKSMKDTIPLLNSAAGQFRQKTILTKGQIVGSYSTEWGESTNAVLSKDVSAVVWPSQELRLTTDLKTLKAPAKSGAVVGSANITIANNTIKTPVVTDTAINNSSFVWRLTNLQR